MRESAHIGEPCRQAARAKSDLRHPPRMAGRECRITVEGELSDRAETAFDGMSLIRDRGNTVLVGRVDDQPQLQGLLQRVSDLGLTLLSATVSEGETTD